jgi:hypothetical protein
MNSSDYVVAIPSYGRPDTIKNKTIPTLIRGGVPPEKIHVHVRGEDQHQEYLESLDAETYGQLIKYEAKPGAMGFRNYLARAYPVGSRVVFCDDDLTRVVKMIDEKTLEDVPSLPDLFVESFSALETLGFNLWGIYPVMNPYFMKPKIRVDLSFIIGTMYGVIIRHDECELIGTNDKDDYEKSIKFYLRDGGVLRLEYIAVDTKYIGEPGGMQEFRTEETLSEGVKYLLEKYPEFVTYHVSPSRGTPEVRLKDKRTSS